MTCEIFEEQNVRDVRCHGLKPWLIQNAKLLEDILLERDALSACRMNKAEMRNQAFGFMTSVASELGYQCRSGTKKINGTLVTNEWKQV